MEAVDLHRQQVEPREVRGQPRPQAFGRQRHEPSRRPRTRGRVSDSLPPWKPIDPSSGPRLRTH
jgi:hypothetical protein